MDNEKVILENIRLMLQQDISARIINKVNVQFIVNMISDSVMYEYEFNILGQKNNKYYDIKIDAPKDWFQHFKNDLFPKFLLKLFPVKLKQTIKTIELDHYALFPDIMNSNLSDKVILRNELINE